MLSITGGGTFFFLLNPQIGNTANNRRAIRILLCKGSILFVYINSYFFEEPTIVPQDYIMESISPNPVRHRAGYSLNCGHNQHTGIRRAGANRTLAYPYYQIRKHLKIIARGTRIEERGTFFRKEITYFNYRTSSLPEFSHSPSPAAATGRAYNELLP